MQSGKESGQHSAWHEETDRRVRAPLIFSSRKNTHTRNAKAPNKGLRTQSKDTVNAFAYLFSLFFDPSSSMEYQMVLFKKRPQSNKF